MKRIDFLTKFLPAAAFGSVLASCSKESSGPAVHQGKKITWKLASSFPRGLDTIYGAGEVLAKKVEELSGGNFQIRIYPAGEIVPGLQVMDAVQQGTIQMGHTASYYYMGKHPALAFETSVPFGLTARQQWAWMKEEGNELIQNILNDFNIVHLPGGNTGTQMGGWFRREIKNLADLKGLKMRIPGLGGQVMNRLGVNVQNISGGDIYPALERGAIDATEWVGPYDDEKLGFYKVAKNYYTPGWWEPGPSLVFYVNKKEWDALPGLYREILRSAANEASMDMLIKYDQKNPQALKRLLSKGVKLHNYSDEIMIAAKKESFALYEEIAAKDPSYRKVYKSWKKFRDDAVKWNGICEQPYSNFLQKYS